MEYINSLFVLKYFMVNFLICIQEFTTYGYCLPIENEIIMFKTKMTLKQLLGQESVFLSLDLWRTIDNISYWQGLAAAGQPPVSLREI